MHRFFKIKRGSQKVGMKFERSVQKIFDARRTTFEANPRCHAGRNARRYSGIAMRYTKANPRAMTS
jgi:hypothetical protein